MRLPAEWHPQAGVQLTWPHADTDWADQLEAVEAMLTRIGVEIARRETLLCVARDPAHGRDIRSKLLAAGAPPDRLLFALAPSNDSWARDHGAITVLDQQGLAQPLDFRFNGWGGKFEATLDDQISPSLAAQGCFGSAALRRVELVLEGGALETDGQGTLLATRSSVISETRNPGMTATEIERRLGGLLGIERFLWLDHGHFSGDDTDGHIDTLARFADPHTILYATTTADDPDFAELDAMRRELEAMRDGAGEAYRLLALPPPGLHFDEDGRRLPATYANFLIINGAVLLPVYAVPADVEAIRIVGEAFPRHQIVPIDCRPAVRQNGSLHCLTMQYPIELPLQSRFMP